jgi:hypothetical protein
MRRFLPSLLAAALLFSAATAYADRTPTTRVNGQKVSPVDPLKENIRVPYLTTGDTAFGAYRVSPIIYSVPVADDFGNPGARPTFNLPFYSGRMGFSGNNNGYVPKPTLLPTQAR